MGRTSARPQPTRERVLVPARRNRGRFPGNQAGVARESAPITASTSVKVAGRFCLSAST